LIVGGRDGQDYPDALLYLSDCSGQQALEGAPKRAHHSASRLLDGRVLVVGGSNEQGLLATAFLFDPATEEWTSTGSLSAPREKHSATLLASGRVLVAGGQQGGASGRVEVYDPRSGSWQLVGSLGEPRYDHSATLLPSDEVLVAGGLDDSGLALGSVEVFDPAGGDPVLGRWRQIVPLGTERANHGATLVSSGDLLVAGGLEASGSRLASVEIYRPAVYSEGRRPTLAGTQPPATINFDPMNGLDIQGDFRADFEASGGGTGSSAVNYPLVRLRSISTGEPIWLVPDPQESFQDGLTVSEPPPIYPGPHWLTVITAGVPSEARQVEVECGLTITRSPIDQTVAEGHPATFEIEALGGRTFQWQQCVGDDVSCGESGAGWIEIPGAVASTYQTPPVTGEDSGTRFRAVVSSGCLTQESQVANLIMQDDQPPAVEVIAPSGGELWLLSDDTVTRTEQITWSMSDNVRICEVQVSLLFSTDSGATYTPIDLQSFGLGGACFHPGEETTTWTYTMPVAPPSGVDGSLYKVRVEVIDSAGRRAAAESPNPFQFVEPNNESVKTLILWHPVRMDNFFGTESVGQLESDLQALASHETVAGHLIDLSRDQTLEGLYSAWDAQPGNAETANDVLFADGGIQPLLLEAFDIFPGVEYVILVGDDRVIPMARIRDETVLFLEGTYPSVDPGSDLHPDNTMVGQALADDRYLSDDPLALRRRIRSPDLALELDEALALPEEERVRPIVPELGIGRLMETPQEIRAAITTYRGRNGVLDLTALGRQVLVTGYDFLIDSGHRVRDLWASELGAASVGELLGQTWCTSGSGSCGEAEQEAALLAELCNDYGVVSLNGHATHYEEGVPFQQFNLHGLETPEITQAACGALLPGSVVYSIGCHSGLPVAGSDEPVDHPLDLPQAMAQLGVLAYQANTGYGWGLQIGIGYGERLIELFSEEMTSGGTVIFGDVVRLAKQRYFLEVPRFDPYDEKSLLQWSLFGFPMYAVKTGIMGDGPVGPFTKPPPSLATLPPVEQIGPAIMQQRVEPGGGAPAVDPVPGLQRISVTLGFSDPIGYTKRTAAGTVVDPGTSGCPDPAGCYYTWAGLGPLVEADHPLQPYFLSDTRIAGTSQHGVLWLGGPFEQEAGWVPILAELKSNGGDGSNHGAAPRLHNIKPAGVRLAPPTCEASDLELSSLVLPLSEVMLDDENPPSYSTVRRFREVKLERLYFNNLNEPEENCDRAGPTFLPPSPLCDGYHQIDGGTVHWTIKVRDEAGPEDVWRVVVVYTDGSLDEQNRGAWVPVELSEDPLQPGTWIGSDAMRDTNRITYLVQAVDRRGNVSWLDPLPECSSSTPPNSGIGLGLPVDTDVPLPDVGIVVTDGVTEAVPGESLTYTIEVENFADVDVVDATVNNPFAPLLSCVWTCVPEGAAHCNPGPVAGDLLDTVDLLVGDRAVYTAECDIDPAAVGTLVNNATISLPGEPDPNPTNDTASDGDTMLTPRADLAITKDDGLTVAVPGAEVVYSIDVTNPGPSAATSVAVDDTFPAQLVSCDWTCAAVGRAACGAASGSGDIHQTVDLPPGSTATYTATCSIDPGATGTLTNTATLTAPPGVTDPNASNDSATDIDLLDPPPTITRIHSVASTGGEGLSGGESVVAAMTQLSVEFSEAVNLAGDEASYQIMAAGANGVFESDVCGEAQGDDIESMFAAAYDAPSLTATLALEGQQVLPRARYRLEVCTSIEDLSGQPLDGNSDGVAGDAYLHAFTVVVSRRLQNPNFDTSLDSWTLPPGVDITHSLDDADTSPVSGSAHASNLPANTLVDVMTQCVSLIDEDELIFGGKVRTSDPLAASPTVQARLEFYEQADCGGLPSLPVVSNQLVGDSGGLWRPLLGETAVSLLAISARVTYMVQVPAINSFEVHFDDLLVYEPRDPLLFADGFEAGNTTAW
ncbi:MAG: kelch repeat-containing protein, partial [Acidobacteriota bacterium]